MKEDFKIIIAYIKDYWLEKRLILKVVGFFFVLGIFVAIFSPKEYRSKTSFVTQISSDEKMGSGLKNIAALIGVNFSDESEAKDLPVYLYPKLFNSLSYRRELLKTPIFIKGLDSTVSLEEYYSKIKKPDIVSLAKKYTIGLPGLILNKFKAESVPQFKIDSLNYITEQELNLISILEKSVEFAVDESDGTIYISVSMPENVAAAQVTENAKYLLQKKIIEYRIKKAKIKFDLINKQAEIKKESFKDIQTDLAQHIDKNLFNLTQSSQVGKQRLEFDYNLAYLIYYELETQKIRQQVKIQEDTPVFTTLQPSIVTIEPINDSAIIIIIKYALIGFIVSILVYLIKTTYKIFNSVWKVS